MSGNGDIIPLMLFIAQEGRCFHCNEEFEGKGLGHQNMKRRRWTRDHVQLASEGHSLAFNTVLACGFCNYKRGNRPASSEEMARAKAIFEKVTIVWAAFFGKEHEVWTKGKVPARSSCLVPA
jgi:hypothetical protein